ncbi:MAG: tatAd 2 [Acidobacteria bacterium]|nr:tatAd 2 [Acidobacteriota bacterium]
MPAPLLILDSLGTSELLLILVVALIFFGPRKLPQLSRQIGKSLAEFKRASEDFKRTWEREVALETTHTEPDPKQPILPPDNSYLDATVGRGQAYNPPPEQTSVVNNDGISEPVQAQNEIENVGPAHEPAHPEPASKRDWL